MNIDMPIKVKTIGNNSSYGNLDFFLNHEFSMSIFEVLCNGLLLKFKVF